MVANIMAEEIMVCKYCWIEVRPVAMGRRTVGRGTDHKDEFVHTKQRNDVGIPFCGRQYLTADEIEPATPVTD
jgi:hypothetical protein